GGAGQAQQQPAAGRLRAGHQPHGPVQEAPQVRARGQGVSRPPTDQSRGTARAECLAPALPSSRVRPAPRCTTLRRVHPSANEGWRELNGEPRLLTCSSPLSIRKSFALKATGKAWENSRRTGRTARRLLTSKYLVKDFRSSAPYP